MSHPSLWTLALILLLALPASADTILLKNGARLDGVITEETKDQVVIAISGGKITVKREQIKKLVRASEGDNAELKEKQAEEEARERSPAPKGSPEAPPAEAPPETAKGARPDGLSSATTRFDDGVVSGLVRLPHGWQTTTSTQPEVQFIAYERESSQFLTFVLVPASTTLGRVRAQLKGLLETSFPGIKLEDASEASVAGRGALQFVGALGEGEGAQTIHAVFVETGKRSKVALIFRGPTPSYKAMRPIYEASAASLELR